MDTVACQTINDGLTAVLDQHGIAKRQHVLTIQHALGLNYPQARRHLLGQSPWDLNDLVRLSAYLDEPLSQLVTAMTNQAGHPALMTLGGVTQPCVIWTSEQPAKARIGPLVALKQDAGDHWLVVRADTAQGRESYEVERLVIERHQPLQVAVQLHDPVQTSSVVDFLRANGMAAQALAKGGQDPPNKLGALVLQWTPGHQDPLIGQLQLVRARNPLALIVLVSEAVEPIPSDTESLLTLVSTFQALLLPQPLSPLSLLSALQMGSRVGMGFRNNDTPR
mgnify:FL=1